MDSRYSDTASRAVPTIGNTLYRPIREISCPLPTDVISRPITWGSRYTPEMVGETPRTTWRNRGRKATDPNRAKPATNPIAEATVNTRFPNRRSGSTGSAARRAESHHPTPSATEARPRPTMTGDPQAYCEPPQDVGSTRQ